jgi:hypothetical protein
LVAATVVLGGCDAWDRLVDRFARLLAVAFLIALVPFAVGGAAGLLLSLRRAPAGASVVAGWAMAVTSGLVIGLLDQFLADLQRHAAWAAVLPALGLPAGAWAIIGSARLARARGLPLWVIAVLGVTGAGYAGWLALVTVHAFG